MNNQFNSPNAWGDYLTALEHAAPVIEAVAVTGYYVTDTYEELLRHKATGRLPNVQLVFPNVELRLDVATGTGTASLSPGAAGFLQPGLARRLPGFFPQPTAGGYPQLPPPATGQQARPVQS